MRTHRGIEVGGRVQTAIDRSDMSRNDVARRANLEPSRLAKFCHGQLPLKEGELAAIARVVDVPLRDLLGVQLSSEDENALKNEAPGSPMSAPSAMHSPVQDRAGDGRRAYIEGHRDELSVRDIEWLQRVRIGVDDETIDPDSERFWRGLLDWHHAEQIRRRDTSG